MFFSSSKPVTQLFHALQVSARLIECPLARQHYKMVRAEGRSEFDLPAASCRDSSLQPEILSHIEDRVEMGDYN